MKLNELKELQKQFYIPEISVDFIIDNYVHVTSKELDNSRYILVTVTESGILKIFDETYSVSLRLLKPDGKAVLNECQLVDDGRVLITLTDQINAVSGCAVADIMFQKGNLVYSTKKIHIDITSAPYPNSTILSSSELNLLTDALKTVEEGFGTVQVSEIEPEKESVVFWINPNSEEIVYIPEINDSLVSETDTWSSNKINEELKIVKKSVSDGKELVADAITEKGVETATDATFETMAENIKQIQTSGYGCVDATVYANGIISFVYGLYTVEESEVKAE